MIEFLPVLKKDFYKVGHKFQYVNGTTLVYSNLTPRGTRLPYAKGAMSFMFQYWVLDHLIRQFNENFFQKDRDTVVKQYKRRIDNALGPGTPVNHIGELHELGFLPLHVKAIPEGTIVPFRVPMLTMYNTMDEFYWLTNMLETDLSSATWQPITSATVAFHYRKVFEEYANRTGANKEFVKWQGHDFSYRGLDETAAIKSGAAHLLSFYGTDTITAIDFLEHYYGANSDTELIGGSVPATEHSVMCMGMEVGEQETIRRLIQDIYPKDIVSIVADTWDFWFLLTVYLRRLKNEIMARDGKVVVRPDSGDPVKIICGDPDASSVLRKGRSYLGSVGSVWWDNQRGRFQGA
jgi:nicotinamide phosphoribosyltransferase